MNRSGNGKGSHGNAAKNLKSSRLSLPLYFPSSPKLPGLGGKKVDGTNTYDLWGTPRLFAWDANLSELENEPLSPVESGSEIQSPVDATSNNGVVPVGGRLNSPTADSNSGSSKSSSQIKKIRRTDSMSIEDMKFTNDVLTNMGLEPTDSTSPPSTRSVIISGTSSLPSIAGMSSFPSAIINASAMGHAEVAFFSNTLPASPTRKANGTSNIHDDEALDEFATNTHELGSSRGLKKYDSLSKDSDFESGELIVESDSTLDSQPSFSSNSDVSRTKSEEFCQHFLKGKCRFRDRCRNSHNVINCIYCNELLPVNRVAASAHLHHCWRLSQKGAIVVKA
jgi:hypothetical protein